jgi:membrane-associated protease RseP (regulator of RpoE activity)
MQFRLIGFPVRVDVSFAIVVALLGAGRGDLWLVLLWVAVVFVSILVHELGHATVARAYGCEPSITLFAMGGLTQWGGVRLGPLPLVVIGLAGPMAGFALGAAVLLLAGALPPEAPFLARLAVQDLLWVNFGWGLLNLLPVLPLDGGQVVRSLLHAARGREDDRLPLKVSVVVGGAACALALSVGMLWAAMLAGLITWSNWSALRQIGWRRPAPGDRVPPG